MCCHTRGQVPNSDGINEFDPEHTSLTYLNLYFCSHELTDNFPAS